MNIQEHITDQDLEKVLELFDAGVSPEEITRQFPDAREYLDTMFVLESSLPSRAYAKNIIKRSSVGRMSRFAVPWRFTLPMSVVAVLVVVLFSRQLYSIIAPHQNSTELFAVQPTDTSSTATNVPTSVPSEAGTSAKTAPTINSGSSVQQRSMMMAAPKTPLTVADLDAEIASIDLTQGLDALGDSQAVNAALGQF